MFAERQPPRQRHGTDCGEAQGSRTRVLVVGLGAAGGLAVESLRHSRNVDLVAGVDPEPTQAATQIGDERVYGSVEEVPADLAPDVVIVSTPTSLHVDTCLEVLEHFSSVDMILCEKPLATVYAPARSLFARADEARVKLRVLYHFAFAPEVLALSRHWESVVPVHGPVISFSSEFRDPKADRVKACKTLGSSWVDAGVNSMSVLARFVRLTELNLASPTGALECAASIGFRSGNQQGRGLITTSWAAAKLRKTTHLRFADGASVALDHVAGRATLCGPDHGVGVEVALGEPTSPVDRYRAMLPAYLNEDRTVFSKSLSLQIQALLARGAERNTPELATNYLSVHGMPLKRTSAVSNNE